MLVETIFLSWTPEFTWYLTTEWKLKLSSVPAYLLSHPPLLAGGFTSDYMWTLVNPLPFFTSRHCMPQTLYWHEILKIEEVHNPMLGSGWTWTIKYLKIIVEPRLFWKEVWEFKEVWGEPYFSSCQHETLSAVEVNGNVKCHTFWTASTIHPQGAYMTTVWWRKFSSHHADPGPITQNHEAQACLDLNHRFKIASLLQRSPECSILEEKQLLLSSGTKEATQEVL